jgi:hypothetical protein
MEKSAVKSDPLCTSSTDGALIAPTFILILEAASLLNTATAIVSIPLRFPSLENNGTVIIILRLAIGEIAAYVLLLGVM